MWTECSVLSMMSLLLFEHSCLALAQNEHGGCVDPIDSGQMIAQ